VCQSRFAADATEVRTLPMACLAPPSEVTVAGSDWLLPLPGENGAAHNSPSDESTVGFDWGVPIPAPAADPASTPVADAAAALSAQGEALADTSRLEQLLQHLPATPVVAGSAGDAAAADSFDSSAPTVTLAREETIRLDDELHLAVEDADDALDDGDDQQHAHDFIPPGSPGGAHRTSHRDFVLRPSPKRRRRRSTLQTIVGCVVGGGVGLFLAGYTLLWWRGPQADFFHMARWLPPAILPRSMQVADHSRAATATPQPSPGDFQPAEQAPPVEPTPAIVEDAPADGGGVLDDDGDLLADDDAPLGGGRSALDVGEIEPTPGDADGSTAEALADAGGAGAASVDNSGDALASVEASEGGVSVSAGADEESESSPAVDSAADPIEVERDPGLSLASNDEPLPGSGAGDAEVPALDGASPDGAADAAVEPPIAAEQPATTWRTTPVVGDLKAPHFYSVDELKEAAAAAAEASKEFVAGDLQTSASPKIMGHAYVTLCAVAERLTLIDPAADVTQLFFYETDAKAALDLVAGDVSRRGDLAEIAAKWWNYPKRHNSGILFVGRVTEVRQQGRWTECVVEISAGAGRVQVPVLMDGVPFTSGSEAAVAGVIIENPRQQIAGYQGDAPQAVIAGYSFDPAKVGPAEADQAGGQPGLGE
jgi:hypothetical protein